MILKGILQCMLTSIAFFSNYGFLCLQELLSAIVNMCRFFFLIPLLIIVLFFLQRDHSVAIPPVYFLLLFQNSLFIKCVFNPI